GSGTVKAYLRIYKISSSASGCPTGTTLATSSTASYSNGTQRSLSVYAPSSGAFSSYVWRYVAPNHYTPWRSACGVLRRRRAARVRALPARRRRSPRTGSVDDDADHAAHP